MLMVLKKKNGDLKLLVIPEQKTLDIMGGADIVVVRYPVGGVPTSFIYDHPVQLQSVPPVDGKWVDMRSAYQKLYEVQTQREPIDPREVFMDWECQDCRQNPCDCPNPWE